MPTASIIIPVYCAEQFLRRCLDSVLAQTFSDWECLLIDDGSPDQSASICAEYVQRDPRFVLLRKENGGAASARNLGMEHARGEFLLFLDSDDFWSPCTLRAVVELQQKHPDDMVWWSYSNELDSLDYDGTSEPVPYVQQQFGDLYINGFIYFVTNKLFRTRLIRQAQLQFHDELVYGEDFTFFLAYFSLWVNSTTSERRVWFLPCRFYFYETGNENSVTTAYKACYCNNAIQLAHRLQTFFEKVCPLPSEELSPILDHLLRTIADGIANDLLQPDGLELARRDISHPFVAELAGQARQLGLRSPFLWAVEHRAVRFAGWLGRQWPQPGRIYCWLLRLWRILPRRP